MSEISKTLMLNILFAVGYFIGGWLGMFFAMPPSHSSSIWPAAGVALAGLLSYGNRVLPGIFIGTLATEYYAFLDVSSLDKILQSLQIALIASFAGCLRTWLGAWLIERQLGRHNPLVDGGNIVEFFLLIILSTAISASICIGGLFLAGVIAANQVAPSLLRWWSGDAIGTVIFTPLILLFVGKPRAQWQARRNLVLYPLLTALLVVIFIFKYIESQEQARLASVFDHQVDSLHHAINEQLKDHLLVNHALKAFVDNREPVTNQEFSLFAESMRHNHRALQALEWIPRIPLSEREQWQKQYGEIRQRTADGDLQVAKEQDYYFPVTYLVPLVGNERAMGYDISSNPDILPVLDTAIASSETQITAGIRLVQDPQARFGAVLYSPVYAKHQPLATAEQRRHALSGFIAAVFLVSDLAEQSYSRIANDLQLLLEIDDGNQVVYNNFANGARQVPHFSDLAKTLTIELPGRSWHLHYQPSSDFFYRQQDQTIGWILLGGLLLCGLTAFSMLQITGRTTQIEAMVLARTIALQQTNQILSQEVEKRKAHEDELRIAATTFESHEAIVVTDDKGTILRVNNAFSRITGYQADEVIGQNPRLWASGTHDKSFYEKMYKHLQQHNQWSGEIWNRRKNGDVFPEWLTLTGVKDGQGALLNYVAIFSDITDKKAAQKEIHELAFYDPLTNLPNRRLLLDRLKQEIAAAKRNRQYGAVFFLDLDHFKTLNDSRGHQVGDQLLIQLAQRLKAIVRHEDTVCRLGGDEFIIMTPGRESSLELVTEHTAILAEKVLQAVNRPFMVQGSDHQFSTSIGVTLFPENSDHPESVIQQADTAMYRAKENGRNSICFFRPSMQEAADKRLMLEKEMRVALAEQQFQLYYQAQVDHNGFLISAEALIRWNHPQEGMISPAEFIPVAEDTQLILPIGEWVLREACQQIKRWDVEGKRLAHVAVNVSSRQFRQQHFVDQVRQALADAWLTSDRLVIELTEGSVISDIDDTIAKMRDLQAMGVRISIDDFGTGYSSLSYLKKLPISQLKIDQSFIRDVTQDVNDAIIVETIIHMAKNLGLNVIAEGVENDEQRTFLRDKGCLSYQGYLIGKPVQGSVFL